MSINAVQSRLESSLYFKKVLFAICPTGTYCREDRCQSFFSLELIPTMRAPLEECEAAGAIRAAGGHAVVLDGPAEKLDDATFLSRVKEINADLIILVLTFGTLDRDLSWAKRFKEACPGVPIGIRGAPCYTHDRFILDSTPALDFSVKGEYEVVFEAIVKNGFAMAPGVTYRLGNSVVTPSIIPREPNLNQLPLPDRDAINSRLYRVRGLGSPQATVRVQRGCPYPCTYCLVHTVSGNVARHRSPAHIAAEIKGLMQKGINCFYLRAETFSLDRTWTLQLCETLARECRGARWVTTTRADRVDDEVIGAMTNAGCYGISFGLDVASKTIAKKVRKYAEPEVATNAFRSCDRFGIVSLGYIMIGFLWESAETLAETDAFLRAIRPDLLTIHFAHPYPGTVYYNDFKRAGMHIMSLKAQAEPALNDAGVSATVLKRRARLWLWRHYSRPAVLGSLAKKGSFLLCKHAFERARRINLLSGGREQL